MKDEKSIFCECLYFSANSLARNLTKLAEEAFAPTGLAPSYAFTLMVVNRNPGVTPSEIAREMHMTPSTITRFLDKLESKGYIIRASDGKKSLIQPTEKSLSKNEELSSAWTQVFEGYNKTLGAEFSYRLATEIYNASESLK
ncbi:MarR family winged helix-turn-helix transcriptional regulator [Marinoscillum sp. MHG1-6]|uniref:MarR family winged helix-turn-helix transcriptional regulator n=1 Tax=Marinoscillum sp. MHG1-6 TaxID=2959627 RepID=UPI0021577F07|nr:MarR family transcriptional regulator [Marinoscillum sp. MHG1-6]